MRAFCAVLLVLVIMGQNLVKVAVLTHWKLNQKQIIENYCVNKAKPKLKCDGKCHLAKQLGQLEASNQNPAEKMPSNTLPKLLNFEIDYFLSHTNFKFNFKHAHFAQIANVQLATIPHFTHYNYTTKQWHPPTSFA
jgi:hypothetical protein